MTSISRWSFVRPLFFSIFKVRNTLLLLAAIAIIALIIDIPSKKSTTRTTMWVVKRRILIFARQNNHLPHSLLDISLIPGFNDKIKDAWGRPLQYEINDNDTITLKSFGRDGLPGGEGEDADILLSFPIHRPDGSWSDPLALPLINK